MFIFYLPKLFVGSPEEHGACKTEILSMLLPACSWSLGDRQTPLSPPSEAWVDLCVELHVDRFSSETARVETATAAELKDKIKRHINNITKFNKRLASADMLLNNTWGLFSATSKKYLCSKHPLIENSFLWLRNRIIELLNLLSITNTAYYNQGRNV